MIFVFVWDAIKELFEEPFSSTGNTLGILGLSVAALLSLWVFCGFVGAIRDIVSDLIKKLSGRARNIEGPVDDGDN
ncbi:MAG: hypothetical protein GY899_09020 [Verrucomicrobiaceae bacterium]|nr:hypothetical protein [Verrucomicrobiaceae bacterium]